MATQTKKNNGEVNLIDIFFYLLGYWPWFVLSVLIFVGLAYYKFEKTDKTYFKSATVLIKDPSEKAYSASLDRYDTFINKVNVTSEIYRFRAKGLLAKVVTSTNADVSYKIPEGLHMKELYIESPVLVSFIDAPQSAWYSFDMTPVSENAVEVSYFSGSTGKQRVAMGDTVKINGVQMVFRATDYLNAQSMGQHIQVTKSSVASVASRIGGSLGIRQLEEDAPILQLSMKDSSPLKAQILLTALINSYNDESINDKIQVALNTERFIDERIKIIEGELGEVEADMEKFKISNDMVLGVGSTAGEYANERREYNYEALNLENQIQMAQFIRDYLLDPTHETELIPANTGISNAQIEAQIAQYNSLRLRRNRLVGEGGDSNPVIAEMASTMQQTKMSIVRSIDNYMRDLQVKKDDFRKRETGARGRLNSIPSKERQYQSIARQVSIKETLYNFLLNRREENAITRAMVDDNAMIIDDPDGSNAPIAPGRNKFLVLGFLVGLALPAMWLLVKLFADTKVRTRRELTEAVTIPFLGEIPLDSEYQKLHKKGEKKVMVKEKPDGITAESFSILRTNLHFVRNNGQPVKVLTLTSFNESSGKTFIAANLAMSIKKTGKKVAMLDLDIRKATLSKLFNCKKFGVTNYLSDPTVNVDDIIQTDNLYGDIDIVAAGPVAPNPAELLADSRLDELVETLKSRYDMVIVDNVPVGIVADAKISNRVSDATIFVARSGRIDRRQLQDLEDLYQNKELTNMLLVLNGTETSSLGYNYGYGYGYGYGRRYGYGYDSGSSYYGDNKEKKWYEKLLKRNGKHHHHHHKKADNK